MNALHGKAQRWRDIALQADSNPLAELRGDLWDIAAEFPATSSAEVLLEIRGVPITLNLANRQLSCQGQTAKLDPFAGPIRLRVLADRTSLEIFVNQGELAMLFPISPKDDQHGLRLATKSGSVKASSVEVIEMHSAWDEERR